MLPGLGTLSIVYESAQTDFINSRILSPGYQIVFDESNVDADDRFSLVSNSIKTALETNKKIELTGIGSFFLDTKNKIHFSPVQVDENLLQPVFAERVIHDDATHNMLVGDKETTTTVMTDFYKEQPVAAERWWIAAAAILVIALSVLCYHFYENGGSFANRNSIEQSPADTFYKEVK